LDESDSPTLSSLMQNEERGDQECLQHDNRDRGEYAPLVLLPGGGITESNDTSRR
jgi:hypothetical protein